jgi:hypothetical protein
MSKVYLVNVGANTAHRSNARCPIFEDGRFIFVPFSHPGEWGRRPCLRQAQPFLRNIDPHEVHDDPDWPNLTYGDNCANRRARALRRVQPNDILLFWSLLWRNTGSDWSGFSGQRAWYLIGALRIREILDEGQRALEAANDDHRARAVRCVHFDPGEPLASDNRVFIGCRRYSMLFPKAVDLEVAQASRGPCSGLIYRTIRSASGHYLNRYGQRSWYTVTRACRAIWDLDDPVERARAEIAASAIQDYTGYDLLDDIT